MKVLVSHTVAITVEEHTPEHELAQAALDCLRVSYTSDRHGGDVTFSVDADDLDEVESIRKAVAA